MFHLVDTTRIRIFNGDIYRPPKNSRKNAILPTATRGFTHRWRSVNPKPKKNLATTLSSLLRSISHSLSHSSFSLTPNVSFNHSLSLSLIPPFSLSSPSPQTQLPHLHETQPLHDTTPHDAHPSSPSLIPSLPWLPFLTPPSSKKVRINGLWFIVKVLG